MSKLLENKQMLIHVAAEIIVIAGVSVFFYKKTKNLSSRIRYLENIVSENNNKDETEQLLKKMSNTIEQQQMVINSLRKRIENLENKEPVKDKIENKVEDENIENITIETEDDNVSVDRLPVTIIMNTESNDDLDIPVLSSEENNSENQPENLDAEIADELNELKDV